jgi:hypothetical protein
MIKRVTKIQEIIGKRQTHNETFPSSRIEELNMISPAAFYEQRWF